MPQGLDLEISHHPLTMRRVVNLVVAMKRLKASKSEFSCSTEFREGRQVWAPGHMGHAKPKDVVSSCQLS